SIGDFDLIICGKQTTDGDTAQVGPEMAEYLNIPHVANVRKIIEVKKDCIEVEMDMPDTVEIVEIKLPALITVEKGIFQPRLPSYKKKIETKNRKIEVRSLNDFKDKNEMNYGLNGSPTQVERIFPPEVNDKREMWRGDSEELILKFEDTLKKLKFI
ncbi:electron transfer flavoprotein subunit beta/FixA family protein, partial [Clostridium saudiense]|nr:electron transfer flavoprotein subunit beta/FixA family protein [Clostridium saudiense]